MIVVYVIIVTSIVNLSLQTGKNELWITLLVLFVDETIDPSQVTDTFYHIMLSLSRRRGKNGVDIALELNECNRLRRYRCLPVEFGPACKDIPVRCWLGRIERREYNEEDIMDRGSSTHSERWEVMGSKLPKSEIVYFCQMMVVYVFIVTSIVNLSLLSNEMNAIGSTGIAVFR
jgi:hypothetical protein